MKTYHLGLLLHRHGNQFNAQFQARHDIDFMSCELYEYYGERETTKARLIKQLKSDYLTILKSIQDKFPEKQINRLLLTIN